MREVKVSVSDVEGQIGEWLKFIYNVDIGDIDDTQQFWEDQKCCR